MLYEIGANIAVPSWIERFANSDAQPSEIVSPLLEILTTKLSTYLFVVLVSSSFVASSVMILNSIYTDSGTKPASVMLGPVMNLRTKLSA
jgi:hypothetical protein